MPEKPEISVEAYRQRSRRSLLTGGVAAVAGLFGWRWIQKPARDQQHPPTCCATVTNSTNLCGQNCSETTTKHAPLTVIPPRSCGSTDATACDPKSTSTIGNSPSRDPMEPS